MEHVMTRRRPRYAGGPQQLFIRIIIGLIVVFAMASAVAIYFEQETQFSRIAQRKEELKTELDAAYAKQGELVELQEIVDTDDYIERIAREKLGMVKPNEIIFEDE